MISPENLAEATKNSIDRRHELQALTSKIRGLNGQLNSVLQKQERLKIEAKRIRRQLKHLSAKSKQIVQTRVNETSVVSDDLKGPYDIARLVEGGVFASDLQEFQEVCAEAESLLAETSELYQPPEPTESEVSTD